MAERYAFSPEPHGAGGFAKVWKGDDNVLERSVAVKVLSPLLKESTESERERFKREARILARMSHPNIPAIYDVEFTEDQFLIVFQFVEGPTLRYLIEHEGPCSLNEARHWFLQITSALEHAHGLGIIHRDVKPENIIITPDRQSAYLVDFGIALSADEAKKLTTSGFVVGTQGYMSPEQAAGEELGQETDIYSLAVTLYEALAGQPISVGQYEELSTANEAIPPQIDDLIQDCIKPRERRLNSTKAFTSRLAGALRPLRPLSEVLAHGRLHEMANAIAELTAEEFVKLPEGQKQLILAKLSDIVSSGDPKLDAAVEEFLSLIVGRGILLPKEQYREIVQPAITWGFGSHGRSIRKEFERAAYDARADAHDVLREEFSEFLRTTDLVDKEDWYLHALREVIQTLLANPSCTTGSDELVVALKKVNSLQRSKASQLPLSAPRPNEGVPTTVSDAGESQRPKVAGDSSTR